VKPQVRTLEREPVDIAGSRLPPPILSYVGGRHWRLEADYSYRDAETTITVGKGFQFDLSSVPRLLWWLIAPFELSVAAPLLHDFLYFHGGRPPEGSVEPPRIYNRAEVDAMFRGIMRKEGVPRWRQVLGYLAVRAFGRQAWCC
jgi:hypothetical protein